MIFREIGRKINSQDVYDVFRYCMFDPSPEKFYAKATVWAENKDVHVYGCFLGEKLSGIIIIEMCEQQSAEIFGISVLPDFRMQGIGRFLIRNIFSVHEVAELIAETDVEAVDFYIKTGFIIEEYSEKYGDEQVKRFHCVLKNSAGC